ncbi:MAG: Alpha-L-arabinofuranosidase-like protein [Phycisphaerales bacterium]|nr:Alpha-L-arabinofuranosidase-like protein [Phycisphaerales bacterium]
MNPDRRAFLGRAAALAAAAAVGPPLSRLAHAQAAAAVGADGRSAAIFVDPAPQFELSPHLYMQFVEPLGATDTSVQATWDYAADDWRPDFVAATSDLAPGMLRYGGLFSRHYKWREGVGPAGKRPAVRNYYWGGTDDNRVGTHEFVDLCRRTKADAMYCVNFASDGWPQFAAAKEENRSADAAEAADWVSYANDPDHKERRANGSADPLGIKYWQLGNETSYGAGGFTKDQSIEQTITFAKAMRARDRSIKLLGWGDVATGRKAETWATDLARRAGEHIDYVAFHMMQQSPPKGRASVLNSLRYQDVPREAWDELMGMVPRVAAKLALMEQALDVAGSKHPLAITEGHLSLSPRNINPILTEWLTGAYHARVMNLYHRHGGRVKIATGADYCGNRWTVNALMIQTPGRQCYLLPAGAVMRLFRKHDGTHGVAVRAAPPTLDVSASRAGDKVFLHVANTDYASPAEATFAVAGMAVTAARVFAIAPESPRQAVNESQPDALAVKEHVVPPGDVLRWRFPARSVSAVELTCRPT